MGTRNGRLTVRVVEGDAHAAIQKAIFAPFAKVTGTEVVGLPWTIGQVKNVLQSGNGILDVLDTAELFAFYLQDNQWLDRIDYEAFELTNPDDFDASLRHERMIGSMCYSTVSVYNSNVFRSNHPKTWRDFWNLERFRGPRILPHYMTTLTQSSGRILEFAELADGVPMEHDELYPIDLGRAFTSLSRIRPGVVKWWTTRYVCQDLLERGDAVLGILWNNRVQDLVDKGLPIKIEWNEAKRHLQCWSIPHGCPNHDGAKRFVDFALQPTVQADLSRCIAYGPTNRGAFWHIPSETAEKLPTTPEHLATSFAEDDRWWATNASHAMGRWDAWVRGDGSKYEVL